MHLLPGHAQHLDEEALGQAVLAHDPGGGLAARRGQLQVPVTRDHDQAVALHAGDGLRHRGPALVQALGDAGAHGDDALLLELEHRAQVHLGGVDELTHA